MNSNVPDSNYSANPSSFAKAAQSSVQTATDVTRSGVQKYEAVVVENRLHNDGNKIRFLITELLPLTKGHLKNNPVPLKSKFKDARGRQITVKGTHNNNFTAEYFSTDTFRKTAPDVQRGERVYVWQKGLTDYWYWEPFNGDSMSKRRLETVVQSVNADKPDGGDPTKHEDSNTYYTEMSSQNKTYTVSTSKANGEVAAYKIQINAGEGSVIICDDAGNHIELDTSGRKIWLKNSCQTEVTLVENNIHVRCNERYDENIGSDKTTTIGGSNNVKISGSCNIEVSGSATVKASSVTLDTPTTTITGDVKIEKSLTVVGSASLGGGGSVSGGGGFSVQGPTNIQGTLTATSTNFPGGNNINGYRRA